MKVFENISFIIYSIFSVIMIYQFYNALVYPVETNFWIVDFGLPIMILEIFNIFVPVFLGILLVYESFNSWPLYSLLIILIIAFIFTCFFNIILFLYFLASAIIRFMTFYYRSIRDENETKSWEFEINTFSLLFAMFLGAITAFIVKDFFSDQISLIEQYLNSKISFGRFVGNEDFFSGAFISFCGVFYFSLPLLLNIFLKFKFFSKK